MKSLSKLSALLVILLLVSVSCKKTVTDNKADMNVTKVEDNKGDGKSTTGNVGTPDSTQLYQKWQLVSIKNKETGKETSYDGKYYIEFMKNKMFAFNKDVNNCSMSFMFSGKDEITLDGRALCTKMCCDSVEFNYKGAFKVSILNGILTLTSEKEVFTYKVWPK